MIRKFIQMHWGLFLFLRKELKVKRTPKQLVYFLRDIAKRYIQVNFQELKNLTSPEYYKQKAEFEKHNKVKADLKRALKLLQYIDTKMVKEGKSRQVIRQFWLDFTKTGEIREEVFKNLEKEIG